MLAFPAIYAGPRQVVEAECGRLYRLIVSRLVGTAYNQKAANFECHEMGKQHCDIILLGACFGDLMGWFGGTSQGDIRVTF
jgi:hypothetical protein